MQLTAFAAQQQQQQAAVVAAPQAQAPVPLPKIRTPSSFAGAMGFAVDDWISEMQQQFVYYGASFPDDAARVRYAVAFLSGSALHWWEHEPGAQSVVSWSEFVRRLHARFRPVQAAMLARQRLGKLRQSERHTVNQYVGAFQTVLTPIVDMGDADQVHHFVNGLLPSIAAKVWERHPKTLVEAIDYAVSVEAMGNFGRAAMPFASRSFVSHHGAGGLVVDQCTDGHQPCRSGVVPRRWCRVACGQWCRTVGSGLGSGVEAGGHGAQAQRRVQSRYRCVQEEATHAGCVLRGDP